MTIPATLIIGLEMHRGEINHTHALVKQNTITEKYNYKSSDRFLSQIILSKHMVNISGTTHALYKLEVFVMTNVVQLLWFQKKASCLAFGFHDH